MVALPTELVLEDPPPEDFAVIVNGKLQVTRSWRQYLQNLSNNFRVANTKITARPAAGETLVDGQLVRVSDGTLVNANASLDSATQMDYIAPVGDITTFTTPVGTESTNRAALDAHFATLFAEIQALKDNQDLILAGMVTSSIMEAEE